MQSEKRSEADDSCFYDLELGTAPRSILAKMAKQWSQQIVCKCFHFVKTVCSHNTLEKAVNYVYLPYIKGSLREYGKQWAITRALFSALP